MILQKGHICKFLTFALVWTFCRIKQKRLNLHEKLLNIFPDERRLTTVSICLDFFFFADFGGNLNQVPLPIFISLNWL